MSDSDNHDYEQSVGDALGDVMAEMAWPGVFAGGKQITATQHTKQASFDVLSFTFNDGTQMNVIGKFEVRYKRGKPDHSLTDHGNQLMSGQHQLSMDEGEPFAED